jgi:hypothetical protein
MTGDDETTIVTETLTTKTDFIEAIMMDLNIRYKIPFSKGHSNEDKFKIHIQLLIAITKAFDKSVVQIYDNKNKIVKSFTEPKLKVARQGIFPRSLQYSC